MAQIAVARTSPGKLCAFFQTGDSTLFSSFQEPAGVWNLLRLSSISGGGPAPGALVPATLTVGDNGTLPVFGMLLRVAGVRININTSTATTGPNFTQVDLPVPAPNVPNLLALGSNSDMMIATRDQQVVLLGRNAAAFTAGSWQQVPADAAVRAVAMSNSTLFGAVSEAFVVTPTDVRRSTRAANGVWSGFQILGTPTPAVGIAAATNGNNLADVILLGTNGRIFHAHQRVVNGAPVFQDWAPLPTLNQPVLAPNAPSTSLAVARVIGSGTLPLLTVFVLDANGRVHTAQQTAADSNQWNAWRQLPAAPPTEPLTAIAVAPGTTTAVDTLGLSTRLLNCVQIPSGFAPWRIFPTN